MDYKELYFSLPKKVRGQIVADFNQSSAGVTFESVRQHFRGFRLLTANEYRSLIASITKVVDANKERLSLSVITASDTLKSGFFLAA